MKIVPSNHCIAIVKIFYEYYRSRVLLCMNLKNFFSIFSLNFVQFKIYSCCCCWWTCTTTNLCCLLLLFSYFLFLFFFLFYAAAACSFFKLKLCPVLDLCFVFCLLHAYKSNLWLVIFVGRTRRTTTTTTITIWIKENIIHMLQNGKRTDNHTTKNPTTAEQRKSKKKRRLSSSSSS